MSAPVRLALIGLGAMGLAHLRIIESLTPWVQITALADSHPPFVERAAFRVPTAEVFGDPLDCLSHTCVDAVVVASADATHYRIVADCITRGIPVLCEKPLTLSAEHSWQLVESERSGGQRLVQVGFMRRYDGEYRYLRAVLASGRVGEPVLVSQRHHNPLAVNDFDAQQLVGSSAAHDIDVFRWLTGEEIRTVACVTNHSADGSTVTVVITLQSQSGILGVVRLGRGPGMQYDIGLDLVGSRGTLTLGSPTLATSVGADGGAAQHLPDTWFERFDGAYRAQDTAWLASVANRTVAGPSAYDGYAANAVAEAALTALRSGERQTVQQMAPDELDSGV